MRKAEDELDAFGGMLQRLDGMRKTDFFWRLPQAEIRYGLLWQARVPSERREGLHARSWAGWKFPFWPGEPHDYMKLNEYPALLRIQKVVNPCLVDVFKVLSHTEGAISVSDM